jgi:hypothetical protein
LHFQKCFFQIIGKCGQMMQTSLDDQHVLAVIRERKLAAIADETFCRASILRDEPGGQIDAFDVSKAEPLEGGQSIAPATKEFHDFSIADHCRTQFPRRETNFRISCSGVSNRKYAASQGPAKVQ